MRTLRKKPIQIYIEPQHEKLLEALAKKKGMAKAEIIRHSLDRYLSELPVEDDPAMNIINLGKSGKGDISKNHDNYYVKYKKGTKD